MPKHVLSVVDPNLWNGMPVEIRKAPTLLAFHKLYKKNYSRRILCVENRANNSQSYLDKLSMIVIYPAV